MSAVTQNPQPTDTPPILVVSQIEEAALPLSATEVKTVPNTVSPVTSLLHTHIRLLFLSLLSMLVLGVALPSWIIGLLTCVEFGRFAFILAKNKVEKLRCLLKVGTLLSAGWFTIWYATKISSRAEVRLGNSFWACLPGIIMSLLDMLVSCRVKRKYPLQSAAITLAKIWRLCIWVFLHIVVTTNRIDPKKREFITDSDNTLGRLLLVGGLFTCALLLAICIIKGIENSGRQTTTGDTFSQTRKVVSIYVSIHVLMNLSFVINTAVVFSDGGFAKSDVVKLTCCFLTSLVCVVTLGLAVIWRSHINACLLLESKEFSKLYTPCKGIGSNSRVMNSRTRDRDNTAPNVNDSSVLQPVINASNGPNERDIEMANFSSRSRLTHTPSRVEANRLNGSDPAVDRNQPQQNKLEVQILEADEDAHDSLESLRFIERKNSVIFGQVNAKKIEGLLALEGMIEKSPLKQKDIFSSNLSFKQSSLNSPNLNKEHPDNLDSPITFGPQKRDRAPSLQMPKTIISPSIRTRTRSLNVKIDTSTTKYQNIVMGKHEGIQVQQTDVFERLSRAMLDQNNIQKNLLDMQHSEGEDSTSKCVVCETKVANCIIYPCYHSKVCYDCCVHMLEWRHSQCHFCRGSLEKIIVIDTIQSFRNIFKVLEVFTISYKDDHVTPESPSP